MFEGTSTEEMVSTCADMSDGFKDVVRGCLCFNPDVSVVVVCDENFALYRGFIFICVHISSKCHCALL